MKKFKKLTAVFLSVLMCVSMVSVFAASADTYYVDGTFKFKYLSDDTAMIAAYYGEDTTLKLPETLLGHTVSSFEPNAFLNDSHIEYVEFNPSFSKIPVLLFSGSTALKAIDLPSSLTLLSWGAFYNCTALTTATMQESQVTVIPNQCFSGAVSLKTVTLSNNITSIEKFAFKDCVSLESINLPASVESIAEDAFIGCDLTKLTISCYSNTYAQQFAAENGISYVLLDEETDKTALQSAMTQAEGILAEEKYYTPETVLALQTAYDAAELVNKDANATQQQVQEALNALNTALESMVKYEFTLGDTNGDSKLTVSDVTAIQLYLCGALSFTPEQMLAADVDGNGSLTISDATALQLLLVKI